MLGTNRKDPSICCCNAAIPRLFYTLQFVKSWSELTLGRMYADCIMAN